LIVLVAVPVKVGANAGLKGWRIVAIVHDLGLAVALAIHRDAPIPAVFIGKKVDVATLAQASPSRRTIGPWKTYGRAVDATVGGARGAGEGGQVTLVADALTDLV